MEITMTRTGTLPPTGTFPTDRIRSCYFTILNSRTNTVKNVKECLHEIHEMIANNECSKPDLEVICKLFVGILASQMLPQFQFESAVIYLQFLDLLYQRIQNFETQKKKQFSALLIECVCSVRSYKQDSANELISGGSKMCDLKNQDQPFDINHLLMMLSNRSFTGVDISRLLEFLRLCLNFILELQNLPRHVEVKPDPAQLLFRLLLDPLTIKNVQNNAKIDSEYKGRKQILDLPQLVQVVWSDNRTDTSDHDIPPRTDGMEVFKQLLSLLSPTEIENHMKIFAKICLDERYLEEPYLQHISLRIPQVLGSFASKSVDVSLLFEAISFLQEKTKIGSHFIVRKTVEIIFDLPLRTDSASLWDLLLEFLINLCQRNCFSVQELKDCCDLCVVRFGSGSGSGSAADNQPLNLIQLGAILCVLMASLHALDCSISINIPLEIIWIFLGRYQEMRRIDSPSAELVRTRLLKYFQEIFNPLPLVPEDAASSQICFYLLRYLNQISATSLDLIGSLLNQFPPTPHDFDAIYFALKVVRCESSDHLFMKELNKHNLSCLLELLFASGGLGESPPFWNLCSLTSDLLTGLLLFC
jgi:hypothetical protein